ncbi:MAG: hypothetical protein AAGF12_03100 [Myxococcota bacterium]
MPLARVFLLGLIGCLGCEGDPAGCIDLDIDGFGVGCEPGPDCDDTNPLRIQNCDTVSAPDCVDDPLATGCPCLSGAVRECYPGPDGTEGVGVCRGGSARCINRHWNLCDGSVVPGLEICDGVDQDCDGIVDDGVQSPCGGCTRGCQGGVWGEAEAPFAAEGNTAVTDLGFLTLRREERLASETVWVANSGEGTLSKIDAIAGLEVARYLTGGTEPSRVAVDYFGDAWVANREFDGVSTVTKVAGERERCVDRSGDGMIQTSNSTVPLPVGDDECVLFTVPVGEIGGVARALAIDGDRGLDQVGGGNVWVGLHDEMAVVVLDGPTGAVLDRFDTPDFEPYAAAFDPWGTLWLTSRDGFLVRVDRRVRPRTAELLEAPLRCFLFYSLAIDPEGDVYISGFHCDGAVRYQPEQDLWSVVATEASTRGATVAGDAIWMSHTGGMLSEIDRASFRVRRVINLTSDQGAPIDSIGVAADFRGGIWTASGAGSEDGNGLATRFDPTDGSIAQVPVGAAPHTQGDLSGAELAGNFAGEGSAQHIFTGCADAEATAWERLHLDLDPGANGTVEVSLRHASTVADLEAVTFTLLGTAPGDSPPYEVDLPEGGAVEVRLVLRTDAFDGAPRIRRVGLEWRCPGPM